MHSAYNAFMKIITYLSALLLLTVVGCGKTAKIVAPDQNTVRVAFYINSRGHTFSSDGGAYNKFPKHLHQESVVELPRSEVLSLTERLNNAGFKNDQDRPPGDDMDFPPVKYQICIRKGDEMRSVIYWRQQGLQVPEKYLSIIEDFAKNHKASSENLKLFIENNRQIAIKEQP